MAWLLWLVLCRLAGDRGAGRPLLAGDAGAGWLVRLSGCFLVGDAAPRWLPNTRECATSGRLSDTPRGASRCEFPGVLGGERQDPALTVAVLQCVLE